MLRLLDGPANFWLKLNLVWNILRGLPVMYRIEMVSGVMFPKEPAHLGLIVDCSLQATDIHWSRKHYEWYLAQARAEALAVQKLGANAVLALKGDGLYLPSVLCPDVVYRAFTNAIHVCLRGREVASLCLQPYGDKFPYWDGVLTRVLMLQNDELEVLRTANIMLFDSHFDSHYSNAPQLWLSETYGPEVAQRILTGR